MNDDVLRLYGPSLVGLDGFLVSITGLPYAAEEIDLSGGLNTLTAKVSEQLNSAGIRVLSSEEYQEAQAPGKLDVIVEFGRAQDGVVLYSVRIYVMQFALLERDIHKLQEEQSELPNSSPVFTWLSPQIRIGQASESILYGAIERQATEAVKEFIDQYHAANKSSTPS